MIEPKADKSTVPLWVTIPIILAAIACGGWIVWRALKNTGDEIEVAHINLPPAGTAQFQAGNQPRQRLTIRQGNPAPNIVLTPTPVPKATPLPALDLGTGRTAIKPVGNMNSAWNIVADKVQVRVTRNTSGTYFTARFRPTADLPSDDEIWNNRTRLISLANELNFTPAQQTSLPTVANVIVVALLPVDTNAIQKGWDAVIAAPNEAGKAAAETSLVNVINAIGVRTAPDVAKAHAAVMRGLLSPEQIAKFHKIITPHAPVATDGPVPTTNPTP